MSVFISQKKKKTEQNKQPWQDRSQVQILSNHIPRFAANCQRPES